MREHLAKVSELRRKIREAGEEVSDFELRHLWDEAQFELSKVRLLGDLAVTTFLEGDKPKDRERKRTEFANAVVSGDAERYRARLEERRSADPPLAPFHWEIEFSEVFERDNPGFHAFAGNPPFQGGRKVTAAQRPQYSAWLVQLHQGSSGGADLVAHFFRRAFAFLREGGAFGLIATNTIAQGDTQASGLRWMCTHGGEIFAVRKRVKWSGTAAVVVSVVHAMKGPFEGARRLDEREVPPIAAFLFHRGGHDDPARLAANGGKSFQGSIVPGMGFTFDDADTKGVATPLRDLVRLLTGEARDLPLPETDRVIREHPGYREVIFPYIGGEEVNTSLTHAHHRYVINFGERSEEERRRRWPKLMAIVEAKVRPERMRLPPKNAWNRDVAKRWWQFGAERAREEARCGEAAASAERKRGRKRSPTPAPRKAPEEDLLS